MAQCLSPANGCYYAALAGGKSDNDSLASALSSVEWLKLDNIKTQLEGLGFSESLWVWANAHLQWSGKFGLPCAERLGKLGLGMPW